MAVSITTKMRGDYGESVACRYLEERGFCIRVRNFMPRRGVKRGEIDIIASRGGKIHFIEVKTRFVQSAQQDTVDVPEASITPQKIRALQRTAEIYLRQEATGVGEYVFDAISIIVQAQPKKVYVRYMKDIFI